MLQHSQQQLEHINICIYGTVRSGDASRDVNQNRWTEAKIIQIDFHTTEHLPNARNEIKVPKSIFVMNANICAFDCFYLQQNGPKQQQTKKKKTYQQIVNKQSFFGAQHRNSVWIGFDELITTHALNSVRC